MSEFETVEVPFMQCGNRRCLDAYQLTQEPWLAEFVKRFRTSFEYSANHDAWLFIEPVEAQQARVDEWQPIDTAPKDGSRIWAYDIKYGIQCEVWWKSDQYEGNFWQNDNDSEPEPTHWRVLPLPPK